MAIAQRMAGGLLNIGNAVAGKLELGLQRTANVVNKATGLAPHIDPSIVSSSIGTKVGARAAKIDKAVSTAVDADKAYKAAVKQARKGDVIKEAVKKGTQEAAEGAQKAADKVTDAAGRTVVKPVEKQRLNKKFLGAEGSDALGGSLRGTFTEGDKQWRLHYDQASGKGFATSGSGGERLTMQFKDNEEFLKRAQKLDSSIKAEDLFETYTDFERVAEDISKTGALDASGITGWMSEHPLGTAAIAVGGTLLVSNLLDDD